MGRSDSMQTAESADNYRPNPALRLVLALCAHCPHGRLAMVLPDGSRRVFDGAAEGPEGEIIVRRDRFARRFMTGGILGFCEAYLDGDWDSPDIGALFEWALRNEQAIQRLLQGKAWYRIWSTTLHLLKPNTRPGARKNIEAHYDLGNKFYAKWLDATMTYSSALFERETDTLETAQRRKYDALLSQLRIGPEHSLLEIGCGWGGFAEHAAREIGCPVTAITISPAQHEFAAKRIHEAGLADKVDVRLQDYRDVAESFDRIASIEMFEAVGERYWPAFFNNLRERLTPEGRAALQIITIEEERFEDYKRSADYIQRYIFPGGMLPSIARLRDQVNQAALRWEGLNAFGRSYAATLRRWNEQFQRAWPQLAAMGFDERFKRLWEQYLHYCAAGFSVGTIDVVHLTLSRGDGPDPAALSAR